MRVLAVDPGIASGMALYHDGDFSSWTVEGQMPFVERVREEASRRLDALVVEAFVISGTTTRKTRKGSNTAIEIIGALKWIAYARGIPFVTQRPSDVMSFMTDAKLRRLGWYSPGADHARDAARHLAVYLLRTGIMEGARVLPSARREEP